MLEGQFDMAHFPDVYNFFSDMGIHLPVIGIETQRTFHGSSNTIATATATAQQRWVELEVIPLPPLPLLHPKDSETPFSPKISPTRFANNVPATRHETAADVATPDVIKQQV